MTPEEKIKICAMCQNRKMSMQKGIVCGLTGEKPQFEENCESYVLDENELEQQKARQELEQQEELSELKNPDENDGTLPGAGWFKTIAILSLLNILLYFIDISFIFGLSSTQLLQLAIQTDFINPVVGVFGMLFIPAFFYLTWWMTAKKGYRFCYNIGYALDVLDAALFVVLMYQSGEMAFIPDLIFHAIALFGGFKILKVNSSKYASDNTPSPTSKLLYTLGASLAAVVSVVSLTTFNQNPGLTDKNIGVFVEALNDEMPMSLGDGVTQTSVYLDGKCIVFQCKIDNVYSFMVDDSTREYAETNGKTEIVSSFVAEYENNAETKAIIDFMIEYGYSIKYSYTDIPSSHLYSITITPADVKGRL